MREFTTRVNETLASERGEQVTFPFRVDGRDCIAYEPTPGQLAVFTAMISDNNNWQTQTGGIINFFLGVLEPGTRGYIAERLLDRADNFEIENVRDIMFGLMEDWTGNPTDGSSASTGSPQADGPTSSTTSEQPVT